MRLLIADDEVNIRNGIMNGIDWKKLGFDEIYIAADGIEALEIFEKNLPEVVITDIIMPGLDGLELSEKIKEVNKNTYIIILSGYSEFEYARKAMSMGITDYQLKPVSIKELVKTVSIAVEKVHEEKKWFEDEKKNRDIQREKLIEDVINCNMLDSEELKKGFKNFFGFEDNYKVYILTIDFGKRNNNYPIIQIKEIIEEWLCGRKSIFYEKTEGMLTVIYEDAEMKFSKIIHF